MASLFGSIPSAQAEPATRDGRFARVAVERGIERASAAAIDGTLVYRVPAGLPVAAGDRVRVPLGRGDKPAEGIVVQVGAAALAGDVPLGKIKPIAARTGAALPGQLVALAEWIAQYYVCPLGMVFASMMPAAVKHGTGLREVKLVSRPGVEVKEDDAVLTALTPAARRAWAKVAALPPETFPCSPRALAAELDRVSVTTVNRLIESGLLELSVRSEVQARGGALPESFGAPPTPTPRAGGGPVQHAPTPEQSAAISAITGTLGRFAVHLLQGVTGSGKTEVYLQAIAACLDRSDQGRAPGDPGLAAIVLVPEIALTPQTAGRFVERFGPQRVAVLHSGLTAAQRHAQWAACGSGEIRVVVGARSAIFAPLPRVGLIVVDEEHDSSYKQDQLPRYHARDVAVKRGQMLGCSVVLGSATPSLESYVNAKEGRYSRWLLPSRVAGALPKVEIVDLAQERRARASGGGWRDAHLHLLGPRLETALGRTLDAGGQAILLLNKRGYANYISCPDPRCGWVLQCDHCDATMVFHLAQQVLGVGSGGGGGGGGRKPGFVRCHHCLAEHLLPRQCPRCSKNTNTFGLGTQRVEEELERKFRMTHGLRAGTADDADPQTTMLRVDGDTMASAKHYFAALDRFARGEIKVMLGTQMIAKGLDFPNVRLVGVINADTALALPDFRATERTFQLVSQVAGRAGRGREPGLVIVQTFSPAAPAIRLAAAHDYEGFAVAELATRERAALPPVGRMARIVCRDQDHAKGLDAARELFAAIEAEASRLGVAQHLRVRTPAPCPISRVAGQHRFAIEILAKGRDGRGVLQAVLAGVRAKGLLTSDAHTAVDIDPLMLL